MENKFVFISYSSVNKPIADAACHILEEFGISCWIAPRNIVPGNTWAGNIVQAIRNCSIMVLIYSEESNRSQQVANEVDKAFSNGKTIIPFMVDATPLNDDFDYYLSRKHWLVAYPDYKEMLMPLVEAVATNIGIEIDNSKVRNNLLQTHLKDVKKIITHDEIAGYEDALIIAEDALKCYKLNLAFTELINLSLDNYKNSQFLMRTILTSRERMTKLDVSRFKYIKEKADEGNSFAQYLMNRYYVHVEYNDAEAYHYAKLCAEQGESYGLYELALCYYNGIYVDKDICKFNELIYKAIKMNDPFAMLYLAKGYLYGWDKVKNIERACTLLNKCMKLNVPESFAIMGDLYNNGELVEKNEDKAIEFYNMAISVGYFESYIQIASTYINNVEGGKLSEGISILREGTEKGVVNCIALLANCYEIGIGVPKNIGMAIRLYKSAAELGELTSFYMLGNIFYKGKECERNIEEAWKWLNKGSLLGNGYCSYLLGVMCEQGLGQEGKDASDCVEYYEASITLNVESAFRLFYIYGTKSLVSIPLIFQFRNLSLNYDWNIKDNKKALGYLKQIADIDTCAALKYGAILTTKGSEFTDELEGIHYLQLAESKGDAIAPFLLARIYEEGEIVAKDEELAKKYYQIAIDREEGEGYIGLANILCNKIIDNIDCGLNERKNKIIHEAYDLVCRVDKFIDYEMPRYGRRYPLFGSMNTFIKMHKYFTADECNSLVGMNEKYVKQGYIDSIINHGIMYENGIFVEQDLNTSLTYYQTAARMGIFFAVNKLFDIYVGNIHSDESFIVDKAAAVYWSSFSENHDRTIKCNELIKNAVAFLLDYEKSPNDKLKSEYIKWIFPCFCDPVFKCGSELKIYQWSDFDTKKDVDSESADNLYLKILPEYIEDLYKTYLDLSELLSVKYNWDNTKIRFLEKEDFFPYLSVDNMLYLVSLVIDVWSIIVKNGKDEDLLKHKSELENLTLLTSDWDGILDVVENFNNEDLQLIIIRLISILSDLHILSISYVQLSILNKIVGNDFYVLPENLIKLFADFFYDGTQLIPKNRAIAYKLYKKIDFMSGVEERLKNCKNEVN